jgi:protein FRA10AC1
LRWRTEKEVISGKGQFECGNKKCTAREGLRSYEVNFAYSEAGESKQALVKLRVCPKCSYKLNYRKEKELERQLRKESRRKNRKLLKGKKREKRGSRRGDVNDKPRKSSSNSDAEDSDESESSEDVEESRFKRAAKREVPGALGKASESKDGEFEPYFKDMFL